MDASRALLSVRAWRSSAALARVCGNRRHTAIVLSGIALLSAHLVAAPQASAGSFTVLVCSHSPSVGTGPFSPHGALNRYAIDHGCRDGGALRVSDDGRQTAGQVGSWRIARDDHAPAGLTPQRLTFRARAEGDKGLRPEIDGLERGEGWVRLAGGGSLPSRRFAGVRRSGRFVAMRLRLRCVRSNGCPEGEANVRAKKVRFVVDDPSAPAPPRPTGELTREPVQRGMQVLGSEQIDDESGIAASTAIVNGAQVSRLPGSCRSGGRSASGRISLGLWRPCANTVTGAAIQTHDGAGPWREGFNQLRLCVADFAGNSSCSEPVALRVDNVCPIRPVGHTAQPPTELRLTFGAGSRAKNVRYPRTLRLRGTVLEVSGEELPTTTPSICIGETLRVPRTPEIQTLTPTIPSGGTFGVAPRASRFFYANYWLDEERVLSSRAKLRIRARPRFAIKPKRARVGRKIRSSLASTVRGPRASG